LLAAGFEVLACDVDEAKRNAIAQIGAKPLASIAELARVCRVSVVAVFNTDQVEQVIEGADGILRAAVHAGERRIVVCVSTCDPDRLAALAARVAPHGVEFLEVPISGTSGQVATGQGVGLVGGARRTLDEAAAVLDAICPDWDSIARRSSKWRVRLRPIRKRWMSRDRSWRGASIAIP
jgi:3-hydroxyisobutyrate dehydrogenase-like beta-hydroxyacid dehydrogenase